MSVESSRPGFRRTGLVLTLAELAILILAMILQRTPGYMDAQYYYAGGLQLAQGKGFTEPFLWNYLDQPVGLPHPSHTYWMPLASLLAFLGMRVSGVETFLAARIPFMIFAAVIPWLTYRLALKLGVKEAIARLAGGLALFPGFYLVFATLIETFVLYMLGGTLFFLLLASGGGHWLARHGWLRYALFGLLAGWMHAARADGLLWLGMAGLVWLIETIRAFRDRRMNLGLAAGGLCLLLLGYGLVMGAWYGRNLNLYGAPFSPGSSRTLWLTNYDQTYTFAPETLTPQNWLAAGWGTNLRARLDALTLNLKNMLAVQGSVFLLPLMLVGGWRLRKVEVIRFGILGWVLTLFAMTVVFPFSGSRGGFLHSGAAFQPLLWVCAAVGLDSAIDAGAKWRGWSRRGAWRIFSTAAIVLAALITAGVFWARVISSPGWNAGQEAYRAVGQRLDQMNVPDSAILLVNNPPGFYVATGRSAIVIPDGNEQVLLSAASRYGAKYLVLDANNPKLDPLFQSISGTPAIQSLATIGSMRLYQIDPQP